MNNEQLTERLLEISGHIAALGESVTSAHKRIDDNDRITDGIHRLAANVEALAVQVKHLADKLDASIKKLEDAQKTQGERIGQLEKQPAKRWESLVSQVITLVIAAAVGGFLARFIQ